MSEKYIVKVKSQRRMILPPEVCKALDVEEQDYIVFIVSEKKVEVKKVVV
ncbi:hypothetical protein [Candidatus Borrarchaeum sp.]|nr:hypothetical protein [Candidatus Borrarchaeum sp.]